MRRQQEPPGPRASVAAAKHPAGQPGGLDFGLAYFGEEVFDAEAFLDSVCGQQGEVAGLSLDEAQVDALERDLARALEQVDKMAGAVGLRIGSAKREGEERATALASLAKSKAREQEEAAKQFRALERRFVRAAETAVQIGSRLRHLDQVRGRASHASALLQYFNEFMHEDELTSTLFLDFPRRLEEAAPFIHDLESIANGLSMQGSERGCKRINAMSDKILTGLLNEFDAANADGDLERMRGTADAILDNFQHKQGPESLFQRFVYYSLNPLVAARKRSIAFKNTALKDNLAHLFSQIRSIVRTTHVVVARVFPRHVDEVLSLLVSRLFNDSVYGLQPMLQDFLYPSHRTGQLPHNEYLQILVTANREGSALVAELERGLEGGATTREPEPVTEPSDAAGGPPSLRKLGRRRSSTSLDMAPNVNLRAIHFDSGLIRRQMLAVFQHFTVDYGVRELKLFDQRMSKRLYSILPQDLLPLFCPDLEPPPEVASQRQREAAAKAAAAKAAADAADASNPRKKGAKRSKPAAVEDDEAAFRRDPLAFLRTFLATEGNNVAVDSLVYRNFQLQTTWREDLHAIPLEVLVEYTKDGRPWRLDQVDAILSDTMDNGDAAERESVDSDQGAAATTLAAAMANLRGTPGQAIRWATEACSRCIDLLADKSADAAITAAAGPAPAAAALRQGDRVVQRLKNIEENKGALDSLDDLFQIFCDRFFLATIVPVLSLVRAQLPDAEPVQRQHASSTLRLAAAEDAEEEERTARAEEIWLAGSLELRVEPSGLPVLTPEHPQVAVLAKQIATLAETRTDFGEALVPEGLELFVACSHAVEDCVGQGLLFWRDLVFAALEDLPERANKAQKLLEQRLEQVEHQLAEGLRSQLQHAVHLLQACALALFQPEDYNPSDDGAPPNNQPSRWCRVAAQVLTAYLELFSRLGSTEAREGALLTLAFAAREVLLGNLRRAKVSLQGSFTVVQDSDTLSRVILGNAFCAGMDLATEAWAQMRLISQLYLVQPDNIAGLVGDSEGGLSQLPRGFVLDCVARRSDFRAAYGSRGAWARVLFSQS